MIFKRLGATGLKVSRLAVGCMSYGGDRSNATFGWTLDERQARPLFRMALDSGINFFDTADAYSRGASETIVGNLIEEMAQRDEVVIATKVYATMGTDVNNRGLSRKHIMASIDASLTRLKTDHVDLYQAHRFDDNTPIEETMEAFHDVVKAGKALYIGATTMFAWQFARMQAAAERNGWTRFVSMQPQYSPVYREDERELFPYCEAEGIGVMNWSPMAGGFLAHGRSHPDQGVTERGRTPSPIGTPYDTDASRQIFEAICRIASARRVPNAVVVYAWLKTKPLIATTLVGATKVEHFADAIEGIALDLSAEEIDAIETPYVPREVAGHKVNPH